MPKDYCTCHTWTPGAAGDPWQSWALNENRRNLYTPTVVVNDKWHAAHEQSKQHAMNDRRVACTARSTGNIEQGRSEHLLCSGIAKIK